MPFDPVAEAMPDQNEPQTRGIEDARRTFLSAAERLTLGDEPALIYRVEPHPIANDNGNGDDK
jgi:hypothetical protein